MKNTPWGIAEHELKLAEGIILYSTGTHGGIWLSAERQKELGYDRNWLNTTEWWEEDHDWAVPYAFFCEAIWKHCTPLNFKYATKTAIRLVKTYHPDMLAIITKRYRAFSEHEKQCDSQRKSLSHQGMEKIDWLLEVKAGGSA